ncbi:MAG TPA: hypothetical protein VKY92_03985 [Verrucomicrobiae bacterium]|nr:hypothetical protein [Verrucomicrobiae bacterium]
MTIPLSVQVQAVLNFLACGAHRLGLPHRLRTDGEGDNLLLRQWSLWRKLDTCQNDRK